MIIYSPSFFDENFTVKKNRFKEHKEGTVKKVIHKTEPHKKNESSLNMTKIFQKRMDKLTLYFNTFVENFIQDDDVL